MRLQERLQKELDDLRLADQFRFLRQLTPEGINSRLDGRLLLNLSSNDYLGLNAWPQLRREFYERMEHTADDAFALSATSSRLLTGNHPGYMQLEAAVSKLYNNRESLVFNSGYHANVGILPALTSRRDLILSDKLNHASIIDGIRLSEAEFKRYPHLDFDRLEAVLGRLRHKYDNVIIITESVFSMDGVVADLSRLVELKEKYDALLVVDEAHGVGVFGEQGCGVCEEQGLIDRIDIIIGTFGKAFCSAGAYAIMNKLFRDYLINKMRSLIFTTGLPPVVVNWSRFVLEKTVKMQQNRLHLQSLAEKLREGIRAAGGKTGGESQIVPYISGSNTAAVKLAERLREAGLLVFPIRPPTVPRGSSRVRFSLTAAMTEQDIERILEIL
ncbi:8-amino-7-oxononanoate synthase [Lentisphaerota bacterium ZTH]|nr:8-amino-7-oxononanoate synthase [Lentisphaerota bacterium]WET06338.1 8-amino-7-oxononanoate synthase [Lentisphaerota bacterium ZTH]